MDICAVTIEPEQPEPVEGMVEAYFSIIKRGGKLRLLTRITEKNSSYCKKVVAQGVEIRHLEGIVGNFAVSDSEFLAVLQTEEFDPRGPVLYSNDFSFVKHHQAMFDMLWNGAVPGDKRIAELEHGIIPGKFDVLYDPVKISSTIFEMISEARKEILVLIPSINSFLRKDEMGLIDSISKIAQSGEVKVKVLTPMDSSVEKRVAEVESSSPIQFQRLAPESMGFPTLIVMVDRIRSISVEIKNDSGLEVLKHFGTAMFCSSVPSVESNASFFEMLWENNRLIEEVALRRSQSAPSSIVRTIPWEIATASFRCIRCGKKVEKEIRIYEPSTMQTESHKVTKAMQDSGAGWIPFCFDCIRGHAYLRPPWLESGTNPKV